MKLLFDQNLSHRLIALLAPEFPDAEHVRNVGLATATDEAIWRFAAQQGRIIVSKDRDFLHRALLFGCPPKAVWLRVGNGPTRAVERLLRTRQADIQAFAADPTAAFLVIP